MKVVSTSFGAEPKNVREARRFVERTLADWAVPDLVEVAALLASELVTNAILHAHSGVDVSMELDDDRLRVEVRDEGAGEPVPRETPLEATSGRGLALVDSLALDWGVDGHGIGKCVWFELPR